MVLFVLGFCVCTIAEHVCQVFQCLCWHKPTASKDDGVVVDTGEREALLAARVRQLCGDRFVSRCPISPAAAVRGANALHTARLPPDLVQCLSKNWPSSTIRINATVGTIVDVFKCDRRGNVLLASAPPSAGIPNHAIDGAGVAVAAPTPVGGRSHLLQFRCPR